MSVINVWTVCTGIWPNVEVKNNEQKSRIVPMCDTWTRNDTWKSVDGLKK